MTLLSFLPHPSDREEVEGTGRKGSNGMSNTTIVTPVTFLNKYPDFNFYNPKVLKKTTIVIEAQLERRGIPVLNRTSYFMQTSKGHLHAFNH